jgi:hypothetical protein
MGRKKADDEKTIDCPEYNGLLAGIEAAKAKVQEAGKDAVAALFKAFFREYPEVTAIGWTQYTPHFNDGEPCEFSLGEFYVSSKTDADWAEVSRLYSDDEDAVFRDPYTLGKSAKDRRLKEALATLVRSANEDIFETAFGDHVMVIATPEGFHVSEYSHD